MLARSRVASEAFAEEGRVGIGEAWSWILRQGSINPHELTNGLSAICNGFDIVSGITDSTAPAAVSNLATSNPTGSSVTLTWTAPGDDGSTGTASSYDVRYSASAITEANWASATQATGEPVPAAAGTNQSMTVSGLSPSTTYYFAMKTTDDASNVSALSNVPTGGTNDVTAPAAVSNLDLHSAVFPVARATLRQNLDTPTSTCAAGATNSP